MPVRSLNSSVLKWVSREEALQAAKAWAERVAQERPEVLRVGCFGSAARGDWGVGSDLDLLLVVAHSDKPFLHRAIDFDTSSLPVPADLLVYTQDEWAAMEGSGRCGRLRAEVRWLYERGEER
ncbi:MAG: nucleotidyltransferase domain-containing protein [Armatimonadota bacterium]|nr:nucleotidyltransferase domain-containing protein [Armatimonadota bacterium]